jgi:hypothetical protein
MQFLSQFEVEVEFIPLPQSEREERSSRLQVLMMRGALRYVAQQAVEIVGRDLQHGESARVTVAVGREDE